MTSFRWLTPTEVLEIVNPLLAHRGWAQLNVDIARVYGAFEDEQCVEIMALQLYPVLGPLLRLDGADAGETTRILASHMETYLIESDVRGVLAVADSPLTERLCKRMGMTKVLSPVYSTVAPGQRTPRRDLQ